MQETDGHTLHQSIMASVIKCSNDSNRLWWNWQFCKDLKNGVTPFPSICLGSRTTTCHQPIIDEPMRSANRLYIVQLIYRYKTLIKLDTYLDVKTHRPTQDGGTQSDVPVTGNNCLHYPGETNLDPRVDNPKMPMNG